MDKNVINSRVRVLFLSRSRESPIIKGLSKISDRQQYDLKVLDPFSELDKIKQLNDQTSSLIIIPRTSGIWFDDIDLSICEDLINKGAHCPIPINSIRILRDKDRQYFFLSSLKLPMLKTLIHRGDLKQEDLNHFSSPANHWVLKSIRGYSGIGIEKFNTLELLSFWSQALQKRDQRYIIQAYLPQAREVRVLCLGSKLYNIEKVNSSTKDSDWKKNAQYAVFKKAELSKAEQSLFLEHVIIIKEYLQLPCFAIDYIEDENQQWKILEVNVHPGLESTGAALKQDLYAHCLQAYLENVDLKQE